MNNYSNERLIESITIALIHQKRLSDAYDIIKAWGEFDKNLYISLDTVQIAITDQYIYRFAKLQDLVGEKLLKLSLEYLQENTDRMPFLEFLNKAQKIGLIDEPNKWVELRESRNQIAHDYEFIIDDIIDLFTDLLSKKDLLTTYLEGIISYLAKRGLVIKE